MASKLSKEGIRAFTAPLRWIIITGVVFFLSTWDINIFRAWIYFAIYAVGGLYMSLILMKKTPQLLNDRGKIQKGTKKKDMVIIISYFVLGIVISPLAAGLDYRFSIYEIMPFYYLYIAILIYFILAVFSIWPMLVNPHFEGTIRIQDDKNHTVIDAGPYQYVRHPGYIAMLLGAFTFPLAVGSLLSLIPAILMAILVIYRTSYEDKTLQNELEGYSDYTKRVKYRLIPFVW